MTLRDTQDLLEIFNNPPKFTTEDDFIREFKYDMENTRRIYLSYNNHLPFEKSYDYIQVFQRDLERREELRRHVNNQLELAQNISRETQSFKKENECCQIQ